MFVKNIKTFRLQLLYQPYFQYYNYNYSYVFYHN
ncbi:unnamed protein product [Amoebophrya sp. A120]|nr:unnamed protein product [Amoebophrya sp. A120]|eukprot:GSA120T00016886001.1